MRKIEKFIEAYGCAASEVLPHYFHATSCLNSCRVTMEVFRHFGYEAKPMVARTVVMNDVMANLHRQNNFEWPDNEAQIRMWHKKGAYMLETGWASEEERLQHQDKKWPHHLVCLCRGYLIDPSSRQMNRPERNIHVPDVLVLRPNENRRHFYGMGLDGGAVLLYFMDPHNKEYMKLSGFQRHENNAEPVKHIIEGVNFLLQQGE